MVVSKLNIFDRSQSQILEIWYLILFCSYLNSLILYREVFVLQTELWISQFKWIMSWPSGMFVARKITQKLRCIFVRVFLPPFIFRRVLTSSGHFHKSIGDVHMILELILMFLKFWGSGELRKLLSWFKIELFNVLPPINIVW